MCFTLNINSYLENSQDHLQITPPTNIFKFSDHTRNHTKFCPVTEKIKSIIPKQAKQTVLFNTEQVHSPSDYGKTPVQEATKMLIHTNPANSLVG